MPLHIVKVRLEFSGFGTRAKRPMSSASKRLSSSIHSGQNSRPSPSTSAMKNSPVSSRESATCRAGQLGHFGEPSCDLVPGDAAYQDNVSRKIVRSYLRCRPYEHVGCWVLRPYMSKEFHQRIQIRVRLKFCIIGICRITYRPNLVNRELCTDRSCRAPRLRNAMTC